MYEITFLRQAALDYSLIAKDKNLLIILESILTELSKNPYHPNLPKGRIPKNGIKMKNQKIDTYHVKLTNKDRIFYRIDKYNKKIIINEIEYFGNINLLKIIGHDL